MTDIVERLRARNAGWLTPPDLEADEAADEIETLREEVALWRATGIDPRMGIRPTGWKWPQENLS